MARKSVPELPKAFEGLKFGFCQPTEPFLEIKHTNFFCRYKTHYNFAFLKQKSFIMKKITAIS